jgi:hypothetical protein
MRWDARARPPLRFGGEGADESEKRIRRSHTSALGEPALGGLLTGKLQSVADYFMMQIGLPQPANKRHPEAFSIAD